MGQTRDAQRFRKVYSYYRPAPRTEEVMGAGGDFNGLDWKQSVRAASIGDVTILGFGGVLDGVVLVNGDRVLLKDQSTSSENGLYYYDSGSSNLVRTVDGSGANLTSGAAVYVEEGSTNAECSFVLTTPDPITVDVTGQTWIKFAGAGSAIFVSTTVPTPEAKTIYAASFDTDARYPSVIGTDVFFFVSGSITGSGVDDHKAVFGGDVVVSGSMDIEGDTLEVSGSLFIAGDVLEVSGSLAVLGNLLEFTGSFLMTGSAKISGSLELTGTLGVLGNTKLSGSLAQGYNTTAGGLFSHAEGSLTNAASSYSHAEGSSTVANGGGSHAEGDGTTSNGSYSHAEGYLTVAQGNYSHAEGEQSVSTGIGSHAEGALTNAESLYSHAEGYDTTTYGVAAHSEGELTEAFGNYSHAEGLGTISSGSHQHVGGKYNKRDNDFSLFVIGDGTSDSDVDRSDILRVNSGSLGGQGSVQITGSLDVIGDALEITGTLDTTTSASFFGGKVSIGYDIFSPGTDVFLFVSGSSGSMGSTDRGVAAFGGDVVVSGALKIGTGSVTITSNDVQFSDFGTRIERISNDIVFYDANNPGGVTLSGMVGGGGGNSTYAQSFVFGDLVGGVLSVNHNLSDQYVSVVVYDDTSTQVMPDSVTATSTTSADVDLTSFGSFVGTWNLSVLASGSTVGGYTKDFVLGDLSGGVLTVNHNLNNQYVSVVIYDDNDNQVVPDSVVATSPTSAAVDLTSFGSFMGTWNVMVLRTGPSNFGGAGGPSYFDSAAAGSIYTSGSAAFVGSGDEWGVVTSPTDKGADVFFYVSGSISGSGADDKKALFGGDVRISGSLSQGDSTTASGDGSHAEGNGTTASGGASHAEGVGTTASGDYSHAEGYGTTAAGGASHAEGLSNTAGCLGYFSDSTSAGVIVLNASYGDVSGQFTPGGYVLMDDSFDSANYDIGTRFEIASSTFNSPNTEVTLVDVSATTNNSLIAVMGVTSPSFADIVMGNFSHAEGHATRAQTTYAHSEGESTTAVGYASHAEGYQTTAAGISSHAEGFFTIADGEGSHAEGYGTRTKASGFYSHAEGELTIAHGDASHAEGFRTIASGSYQHVSGKYNKRGNNFSLFVIGDGINDADVTRSDIVRVNPGASPGLGRFQVTGSVEVSGSYLLNVTSGTIGSTYNVNLWDHVVVFTDNNVTATLPPASPVGAQIFFKDGTGNASVGGGQLLSASVGGLIDGTEGYTMPSVDYAALTLIKVNDSPETWIVV